MPLSPVRNLPPPPDDPIARWLTAVMVLSLFALAAAVVASAAYEAFASRIPGR